MLYSAEFDGIHGYCSVALVDNGDGTERVRLEHYTTADQDRVNQGVTIPRTYFPKRIAGIVFPTRIVEFADVPKGRFIPTDTALSLVRKHLGEATTVEWMGRGWHIHYCRVESSR